MYIARSNVELAKHLKYLKWKSLKKAKSIKKKVFKPLSISLFIFGVKPTFLKGIYILTFDEYDLQYV